MSVINFFITDQFTGAVFIPGLKRIMICHIISALSNPHVANKAAEKLPSCEKLPASAIMYTLNGIIVITHKPAIFNFILNGRSACGIFFLNTINETNSRNKPAPYKVMSIIKRSANVHKIIMLTTTAQTMMEIYGVLNFG